jgi:hypothetical protein
MFDKFSDAAEKLATNVSRRGFLGSVGRWAGATALAMAGVLTSAGTARANQKYTCCQYCWGDTVTGDVMCCSVCVLGTSCPSSSPAGLCPPDAALFSGFPVGNCNQCNHYK